MPENQDNHIGLHGGARKGAGRPRNGSNARWYAARGINPLMAGEILATVTDERRTWKRLLESQDDRIVLQAMMFLVSQRDGKPAQQINVTSTNINLNGADVERARAIAAEIRGSFAPDQRDGERTIPSLGAGSIMLLGDEGLKKDG